MTKTLLVAAALSAIAFAAQAQAPSAPPVAKPPTPPPLTAPPTDSPTPSVTVPTAKPAVPAQPATPAEPTVAPAQPTTPAEPAGPPTAEDRGKPASAVTRKVLKDANITDASGATIGTVVNVRSSAAGDEVLLKVDGKVYAVPRSSLTDTDGVWVSSQTKAQIQASKPTGKPE